MQQKDENRMPRYQSYIQESMLSDDYQNRKILFDTDIERNAVPYKNSKYQSVGSYREVKKYPEKEIDQRAEQFSLENFSAHGTTLLSVISALQYSNKQLVPGIKLRKLIGASSTSGESKGLINLSSPHINNKAVSAIKLNEKKAPDDNGIYIALGYSQSFLSGIENSATNIPVLILGDGVGSYRHIGSRAISECAWQRLNIRMLVVPSKDKADLLALLRAMEIYDIKICTTKELADSYINADQNSSLRHVWEQGISANPDIPLTIYEEEAENIRASQASLPTQLPTFEEHHTNSTGTDILKRDILQETTVSTDQETLEAMHALGQDSMQETVHTGQEILETMQEIGKASLTNKTDEITNNLRDTVQETIHTGQEMLEAMQVIGEASLSTKANEVTMDNSTLEENQKIKEKYPNLLSNLGTFAKNTKQAKEQDLKLEKTHTKKPS